ncbi:uncharacterized protein BROUX77_005614 [Berkeleyomyces rouxiae]|uniref:uncharacterized protein n=1 Tax=Berkeleyomyces rouxiae TaxID=2035830 RepID=UPI003B7C8C86
MMAAPTEATNKSVDASSCATSASSQPPDSAPSLSNSSQPTSADATPAGHPPHQLPTPKLSPLLAEPAAKQPQQPPPTSASASPTEGSDSDTLKQDAKKPDRLSSLKKPATFKAVSVNKTFLAAASGSQAKPREKSAASSAASTPPTTSTLPASRPRLIAKTAGSGPLPKFAAVNSGRSSMPEPAGVWNKNPPPPAAATPTVAPAAPAAAAPVDLSKLSDEELKKHGIHVASRLQSDDSKGSHNNWADIEDDDDEWAVPDSITWTDGTKTTLPSADEALLSSPLPPPASPTKPHVQTPTFSGSGSGRLSGRIPSATPYTPGGSKPGVILRHSTEKPSLVAKAPASAAPAKSPWATLPAVDRASPVAAFMSSPQQSQRTPYSQHQGYNSSATSRMPPPHDAYQPRNFDHPMDRRSGDFAAHPDYMMQRSRQATSQAYKHSSGYPPRHMPGDGPYTRNRSGSSNMGQGPDRFNHMTGISPTSPYQNPESAHHDHYGARRPSFNSGPPPFIQGRQHGHVPGRSASGDYSGPNGPLPDTADAAASVPGASNAPHHSPGDSSDQSTMAPGPRPPAFRAPQLGEAASNVVAAPAGIPEEETAEFQKKLMRERAEEAMRRRQEEERREEAAKQERLRLKLEAMGPAPERQSAKKQTPLNPAAQPSAAETPAPAPVQVPAALQARLKEQPIAENAPATAPDNAPASATSDKASNDAEPHAPKQTQVWESSGAPPPHPQVAGPPPSRDLGTASWGSGSSKTQRNVWGAPNNDRGLGNGTFITDMSGLASVPPTKGRSGPAPIGPPSTSSSAGRGPPAAWNTAAPEPEGRGIREARPPSKFQAIEKPVAVNPDHPSAILKPAWRNSAETETVAAAAAADFKRPPPDSVAGPAQPRPSRFFPTRDYQVVQPSIAYAAVAAGTASASTGPAPSAAAVAREQPAVRARSPSPPPPIAEDHPVYDGNPSQPMVSLPKPQPVVKLPPLDASALPSARPAAGPPSASGHWQDKINSLLSGHKPYHQPRRDSLEHPSPQPHHSQPAPRAAGHAAHHGPAAVHHPAPMAEPPTTMPMSTECFEEPEMGSLPSIHIPKDAPEAAWNPATAQTKPLPRRFAIIHNTSSTDPDFYEPSGQIKINLAGMPDPRFVFHACATRSSRTQSRSSAGTARSRRGNNRATPRHDQPPAAAAAASSTPATALPSSTKPQTTTTTSTSTPATDASSSPSHHRTPAPDGSATQPQNHQRDPRSSRAPPEPHDSAPATAPAAGGQRQRQGSGRGSRGGYKGRSSEWTRRDVPAAGRSQTTV